jgi:TPR repeat protein
MLNFVKNLIGLNTILAGKIQSDRLYQEAEALMAAGKFKNALPVMMQASDAGNKYAPVHVAMMLLKGQGTPPNWNDAVKHLELAISRGNGNVHVMLGMIYGIGGYGLRRNHTCAENHLTQSITADNDPAGEQMLAMLKKRQGVFGGKEVPRPKIPWK